MATDAIEKRQAIGAPDVRLLDRDQIERVEWSIENGAAVLENRRNLVRFVGLVDGAIGLKPNIDGIASQCVFIDEFADMLGKLQEW